MRLIILFILILTPQFSKAMTETRFKEILTVFSQTFEPFAHKESRNFEILASYKVDWAQAFARRWEQDQLIVYGGITRIPGSTDDSFALGLCHEVGHLYGGDPVGDEFNRLSLEGQADYWATGICWPLIAPQISSGEVRARALEAALVLTKFFAANRNLPPPTLDQFDPLEVGQTLRTHPTPQCRLDTLKAGLDRGPRPSCWFAN